MIPIIDHINRHVSDVWKHADFYTGVLGYELIGSGLKTGGERFVILRGSGHELFLSEKEGFSAGTGSLRHIGYAVPDIEEFRRALLLTGYSEEDLQIVEKPCSRQIYLRDPDGMEIDVIQWTDKEGFYGSQRKE